MLHEFITRNRDDIVRRCRVKASSRPSPAGASAPSDVDHGVPLFLDQLVGALRQGLPSSAIGETAILHGHDLLKQGFSMSQVVHGYGDVCQSITELAVETAASITVEDFRVLNGCLDDAIAGAVTQYGSERNQSTIDGGATRENERVGFLVHELRNLIQTASVAFEVIKSGNVGVVGSTGAVLERSLAGARDLLARSVAGVRLSHGVQNAEQFCVSDFIGELGSAGKMVAAAAGVTMTVAPVDAGIQLHADRQTLAAAVMNLVQNAVKFTRAHSSITLRVGASVDRVLIEIQDACGGLPCGDASDLFRSFEQRSTNRSGLGLGLAFSRAAVEANHGRIYARNLPKVGCIFTIDLPRLQHVA
jgi:signal transduction histidine kinase